MDESVKSTSEQTKSDEGLTPEAMALLPRVQQAIDEVRPALQADGGDIELLGVTPGLRARVRLLGACHGCPSASITLSFHVENYLREQVPEIVGVELEGAEIPLDFPYGAMSGWRPEDF